MNLDQLLSMSPTLSFSQKARELREKGKEIYSLGLGEPDFETPKHICEAAKKAIDDGLTKYSAANGLLSLRKLIAKKLCADNKINAEANEIIITPGAKNALYLACSILDEGEEVINLSPCYVSNEPAVYISQNSAKIKNINLKKDNFSLDREKLLAEINSNTKFILANFPNNPTGKILSSDDFNFLVNIIKENDIYLISDEIYEKIIFSGESFRSFGSVESIESKVITVNGFSKAYSMTGWRIGYIHTKSKYYSRLLKIHQHINTNTAAFIQKGAEAALEGSQAHIMSFIESIQSNLELFKKYFSRDNLNSNLLPQGGYFVFLDISSSGLTSDVFATKLLEKEGVAIIPGVSFGRDFDGFCRVSLVGKKSDIDEGYKRLARFLIG